MESRTTVLKGKEMMGDDDGHADDSREESECGKYLDRYSSGMRHSEGGWRGAPRNCKVHMVQSEALDSQAGARGVAEERE